MKKLFTGIAALLILGNCYGLDSKRSRLFGYYYDAYQPKLQYEYYGLHNISLGIANLSYDGESVTGLPWSFHGAFADVGIAFDHSTALMTNKVGYEYFFLFFGGRLNWVNYTDFSHNHMSIRPEIGLTLVSFLTMTYGFNFHLQDENMFGVGRHVVSLNIGLLQDK